MTIQIEAYEVDDFTTAIAGLEIEYVRTGAENDPCRTVYVESDDLRFTRGWIGFSVMSHFEVPSHLAAFSFNNSAPTGSSWCGITPTPGAVNVYGPGTPFVAKSPVGFDATVLVATVDMIEQVAHDLGVGDPDWTQSVEPLARGPEVLALELELRRVTDAPELMDDPAERRRLLDSTVTTLVASRGRERSKVDRRLDSKRIVLDCIDYVESTGSNQPSMSELCRAATASQSRVRQAFVEVLAMPPTQYFHYRLLSRLRDQLLLGDPDVHTVTRIAASLGVTQLGRIAGRYRRVFEELPSDTLRR